ncbi:MAG TPA: hypothetical protein VHS31_14330 [Tepidisphaeraceae bacterium]|jgi:hypothetical protein|nr:hypothetical protein [Tepidisphaeraceae bacterium]
MAATTPVNFTLNLLDNGQTVPVAFRAWIPDGVDRIRGLIFNLPGSNLDTRNVTTNGSWQAVLPGMGFGIVGLRDTLGNVDISYWGNTAAEGQANIQAIMNAVASAYNHPEISNAPIMLDGISKGSLMATYIASMVPQRTIGYVADKGLGATVDPADPSPLSQMPGLVISGSEDQTFPPLENFLTYTGVLAFGGHIGEVIDWGVGHHATNPPIRYAFIAQAIRARYPKGQVPSLTPGNPLQLVNNTAPWLGEANTVDYQNGFDISTPFNPISWAHINPVAGNTVLDPTVDSWLPTQAMAMVFQTQNEGTFNTSTRPLQISVPNAVNTSVNNGQPISIAITLTGLTSNHIALYHDEDLIAVFNQSAGLLQYQYMPTENGLQTFIAIADYSDNGVIKQTGNYVVVGVSNLPEPGLSILLLTGAMARRRR